METPEDRRYTEEHEWAKKEGGEVLIGISDFAQSELGDVVFVDFPEKGARFKRGESLLGVESVKAVSDVYAPLDCVVTEINEALNDAPNLINESPYAEGWMLKVAADDLSQLSDLMDAAKYDAFVADVAKH